MKITHISIFSKIMSYLIESEENGQYWPTESTDSQNFKVLTGAVAIVTTSYGQHT